MKVRVPLWTTVVVLAACSAPRPPAERARAAGDEGEGSGLACPRGPAPQQAGRLEIHAQGEHLNAVNTMAFTADGRRAVTSAVEPRVRLWDLRTGREIRSIVVPRHVGLASALALHPDGRTLAISRSLKAPPKGRSEHVVLVYDLERGQEVGRITWPEVGPIIRGLAYDRAGRRLVVVGSGIRVHDARSFVERKVLAQERSFSTANLLPDDRTLLAAGPDNTLEAWDLTAGKLVRAIAVSGKPIQRVAVSRDGAWAALSDDAGAVVTVDLKTGLRLHEIPAGGYGTSVCTTDDGTLVVGRSDRPTLEIWRERGKVRGPEVIEPPLSATALACSRGARRALVANYRTLLYWDLETRRRVPVSFSSQTNRINALAISRDGRLLATAGSAKSSTIMGSPIAVHVWDLRTGRWERSLRGEDRVVAFSHDGRSLVYKDRHVLRIQSLGGERQPIELKLPENELSVDQHLAITPDGKRVLLAAQLHERKGKGGAWGAGRGSGEAVVFIFEPPRPDPVRELRGCPSAIDAMALSPDGRRLAVGSADGTLLLYDVASGEVVRRWAATTSNVAALAFSPTGDVLATAGGWQLLRKQGGRLSVVIDPIATSDTGIKLWDHKTARLIRAIPNPRHNTVSLLRFAPGGRTLVAGRGSDLVAWDPATGNTRYEVKAAHGEVTDLRFDPAGKLLLSSGTEGTVRYHGAATGQLLAVVRPGIQYWAPDRPWMSRAKAVGSVVVAPDGHFDYSNRGALDDLFFVRGFEVVRLQQLLDVFFQPGLLRRVLDGTLPPGRADLSRSFPMPPAVTLEGKQDGARLVLRLEARDAGGGLQRLALYRNGRLVPPARGEQRRTAAGLSAVYRLAPAEKNAFVAVGVNPFGIKGFSERVDLGAGPAPKSGRALHLLGVGVNKYGGGGACAKQRGFLVTSDLKDPKREQPRRFGELCYPCADARAVMGALARAGKGSYAAVKRRVLCDGQATRAGILAGLQGLAQVARPRDTVVVFLGGHGIAARSLRRCFERNEYYFVPSDYGTVAEVPRRGLSASALLEALAAIRAEQLILMLDTCRAGATNQVVARDLFGALTILGERSGVHVLAAASATQSAGESDALRHGYFTHALLGGLRCAPGQRELRFSKLAEAVDRGVRELQAAGARGAQQSVVLSVGGAEPSLPCLPGGQGEAR